MNNRTTANAVPSDEMPDTRDAADILRMVESRQQREMRMMERTKKDVRGWKRGKSSGPSNSAVPHKQL